MKLGIMQPYFLPYIGYFQLIAAVDVFIVYDNIQYTKKGWINRNRFLQNGTDALFSLPLKKASDYLDVRGRDLAYTFERSKLLEQLRGAYRRAPCFDATMPLLERVIGHEDDNLFRYILYSIRQTCAYLCIDTEIRVSSAVDIDHGLKGQDKVLALTQSLGGDVYCNAFGGLDLYSKDAFAEKGIQLQFLKSGPVVYEQFGAPFVPWLSIVDVMMFNPVEHIKSAILTDFDLV